MRLSLRTKITTLFVLFGLVPSSIMAYYAFQSADEHIVNGRSASCSAPRPIAALRN